MTVPGKEEHFAHRGRAAKKRNKRRGMLLALSSSASEGPDGRPQNASGVENNGRDLGVPVLLRHLKNESIFHTVNVTPVLLVSYCHARNQPGA